MNKQKNGSKLLTFRTECKECTDKRTRKYHQDHRDRMILNNCRKAMKHRGVPCTLTRADVQTTIVKPCSYCGETNLDQIGIDRVNNNEGYHSSNITSCCTRCNAMKRDMPLQLWMRFVPLILQLQQEGAFGDWAPHNLGRNDVGKIKSRRPRAADKRLRTPS